MRKPGIVVLTDSPAGEALSRAISRRGLDAGWCRTLEELIRHHSLPSLSVLVFHLPSGRKGPLLTAVGRMALEYPRMQKVAIVENPLSIPIVIYLTACTVEVLVTRLEEASLDRIVPVVGRARERQSWSLEAPAGVCGVNIP